MMIPSIVVLSHGALAIDGATKLTAPDDKGVFK